ncbi:PREDICTED: uncharacterized protein LOC107074290 [Polistes dominula]|uniref:Uncharacterized protein LOC107074290 n=1 Tax=Polistes dominula TaxID=743375 RepID=A0ABM1JF15_POLDO|nr:PREDICTED: uncharacterized protein LOC107074290 [Polistes dominula]
MIDIKESKKEDEELLLPDVATKKFNKFSEFNIETVIMKGVVKQLEKWPSYLFFVFFIGCIVIVNLVLLIIATVTFSLPTNNTNINNNRDDIINGKSINVYSIKEENRIWSMIDFCYIESAARENPELNINLINIYKEIPKEDIKENVLIRTKFEPEISRITNAIDLRNKESKSLRIILETRLRDQLARKYENVNTQNIIVDNFFEGTNLSKVVGNLNNKILKLATEAYFIWNSSGIAINPKLYCNLKYISQVMCKKENEKCVLDALATIDPKNDIQAAGVPCQIFLGYFINEISKNDSIRKGEILLKSINSFCPRTYSCNEIRILKDVKRCTLNTSKCPIVYNYMLPHLKQKYYKEYRK